VKEKLEKKIREWNEKIGKVLVDEDFEKWIELNTPLVVSPLYDQVTIFDHSDLFFAVSLSRENGLNTQIFGIGAFAPNLTQDAFENFLHRKGEPALFNLYLQEKKSLQGQIANYLIAVNAKEKQWFYAINTFNPQKAVILFKTTFDGRLLSTITYSYNPATKTLTSPSGTFSRIHDATEQKNLLSTINFFSPDTADRISSILSLNYCLTAMESSKNKLTFILEPILT